MSRTASLVCLLLISACANEEGARHNDAADFRHLDAANSHDVAENRAASPEGEARYAEARRCFIDVGMRTMVADPSSGGFQVNPGIITTFRQDVISAGRLIGKAESEVIADLQGAVAESARDVEHMSQHQKEQYVLSTTAHAIECMRRMRDGLASQPMAEASRPSVQEAEERRSRCVLNEEESLRVFEQFVRLEDRRGKNNAAHEVIVGRELGLSPECVRQTMILSLERGRVPPSPE